MTESLIERLWFSGDALASAVRTLLVPAERTFRGIVGVRDMLYDAGWLPSHDTAIPAVSVGNLTVGGTGKTPIAAWIAEGLKARGARPAIVLRGYGDDEPLVHRRLNPGMPVVTGPDRVTAIAEAARQGADVAVLDDAFQHRQARRAADIVLISADAWTGDVRLLPAGPWREPLESLRRATLTVVTRKASNEQTADLVHARLAQVVPQVPRVGVRLALGELVRADESGEKKLLSSLAGATVHVVLSIADPGAFIRQLEQLGATVKASVYGDHHVFTDADMRDVGASLGGASMVVCTLKDAVKLGPRWPRLGLPLWYVSQRITVERGVGGIERVLDDLVLPRSMESRSPASPASPTAG